MIHRRLLQLAGAIPASIIVLALYGIAISALNIGFALGLAVVLTSLIRGEAPSTATLALIVGLAVARAVAIWGREPIASRIGAGVRIRLRRRLLDRLAGVPARERESGATATTLIDGVEGLDPYYTRYLPQLIVVLVVPVAVVVMVWQRAHGAGIVLAVVVAIAVVAPRAWDARLLRTGRTRWDRQTTLAADYVEALQNIPLLRSFGATDRVAARFVREADGLRDSTMAQLRLSLVETGLSALAMHLGTVLAIMAAVTAVTTGSVPAGTAVVVLMLARECFRPVQDLGTHWHAGYLGLTAVDGIDRLLSIPLLREGTIDRPATTGAVEVVGVSYRYPGTESGVADLSLRIGAGETVAVIGPSGSGKSTLARLLERDVEPDTGTIVVDGVDLLELTTPARTRSVVVVPQDPVLFAWTVTDNLRLHRPDASDAEIEAAARTAQVHEVITALPDGYQTMLAENGEQLSGGERQRLAIARALVSPMPLLVFDEVTSALDADTERRVIDAVAEATQDRTVVIIAHRESACTHAVRWLSLRDGRVVAQGVGAPSTDEFLAGQR